VLLSRGSLVEMVRPFLESRTVLFLLVPDISRCIILPGRSHIQSQRRKVLSDLEIETSVQETEETSKRVPLGHSLPDLYELHLRHVGITPDLCRSYAEAVRVCLSRHHEPPIELEITSDVQSWSRLMSRREVWWSPPNNSMRRAWANLNDATRDAACLLSLAVVEAEYGMVVIARADTGTGADYYIGHPGDSDDLESAFRLEVSGIDRGGEAEIRSRLRRKVLQVRNGQVESPALVSVIGFAAKRVAISEVDQEGAPNA
jgi:hypothetical protein